MAQAQAQEAPPKDPVAIDFSKITDEDSAAEQLAGVFAGEDDIEPQQQDQQSSQDAPAADSAEPGTAPSAQDDTVQDEPETAIVAPVSWTADDKQLFAKLPPETQQILLRRESERDRGASERIQKATEQAQRLEQAFTAVANERAQAQTFLQGVLLQVQPELAEFQQLNWVKLAEEQPAEWARQQQRYQSMIARQQTAQQQILSLQQQQQADNDKRMTTKRVEEEGKLLAKVPELADQKKAADFVRDIGQYFVAQGYDQQELPSIGQVMSTDHRLVVVARKAMLYDQSQKLRAEAQTKRVPAAQGTNVRPLRPAARSPSGAREEANQQELTALHGNLVRTGSVRDATSLLEKIF